MGFTADKTEQKRAWGSGALSGGATTGLAAAGTGAGIGAAAGAAAGPYGALIGAGIGLAVGLLGGGAAGGAVAKHQNLEEQKAAYAAKQQDAAAKQGAQIDASGIARDQGAFSKPPDAAAYLSPSLGYSGSSYDRWKAGG